MSALSSWPGRTCTLLLPSIPTSNRRASSFSFSAASTSEPSSWLTRQRKVHSHSDNRWSSPGQIPSSAFQLCRISRQSCHPIPAYKLRHHPFHKHRRNASYINKDERRG